MRIAVLSVIALILLTALARSPSPQTVITITGADQTRDLAPAASDGLASAATGVSPRIQLDSPNYVRILPLVALPAGLAVALADASHVVLLPLARH
jgi:hypothetical protein